jgi:hypothetical protein
VSMSVMIEEAGASRRRSAVAWLCLLVARRLSRLRPTKLCSILAVIGRGARTSRADEAQAARASVCLTSTRASGMECLERSVAVYLMCRLRGHVPTWCTGFRVDPFAAHAWVEVDAVPVGEPPEISLYSKATVVGPTRKAVS